MEFEEIIIRIIGITLAVLLFRIVYIFYAIDVADIVLKL